MSASITQEVPQRKQAVTRTLPYLEIVAIVCLGVFILVKGVWVGWRQLGTDFPQYYLGAKLVAEHYNLDRFYEWSWLQRQACYFGIHHEVVGFPGLTPFSMLILLPLAWLNVMQAKHVWIVLNIAVLIAAMRLLSKASGLSPRRAWLIALLAVFPLRNDFALGQMHLIVFALLVLGWHFHMRGKQVASGCCIALAGALKIYPLFYCLYFAIKKRWRALGAAVAASIACGSACVALFGTTATGIFIGRQLPCLLNGEALDPFLASATSASAVFHRLFLLEPEWNPHPLLYSPILYAVLYALWQALPTAVVVAQLRPGFAPDQREAVEWCAFLTLLMFLSSQPETYHFVALIAAAVPTYAILRQYWPRISWMFLGIYAIACNARNVFPRSWLPPVLTIVSTPKLWAELALIVLYLVLLSLPPFSVSEPLTMTSRTHDRKLRVIAGFGLLLATLWLVGFVSSLRHVKSMSLMPTRNMIEPDKAWMRAEPRFTDQGLYYVAMMETGYKVMHNGVSVYDVPGEDQLSYAVDGEGTTLWIESAMDAGLVIREVVGGHVVCEVLNGESPTLSEDGNSLAFIREEQGRGSLWVAESRSCATLQQPTRVTPQDMDVRAVGAIFKDHFVFSAMTKQGPVVFLVSRGQQVEALLRPSADVNSIAISQDGRSIVLSELSSEHWQLVSNSLRTHAQKQITFGACNATDPFWKDDGNIILYATDCGRSMGLSTVAEIDWQK